MKRSLVLKAVAVLGAASLALAACSSDSTDGANAGDEVAADVEVESVDSAGDCAILGPGAVPPRSGGDKYTVYMTSLNIGNSWQEEAQNTGTGIGQMAPYSDCVDVIGVRDEADPQAQISQVQSMVADVILLVCYSLILG